MKVLVMHRSLSTSQGIVRGGDEVDLPEVEVKKIMAMKPTALQVLKADPKPAKKASWKKKAAKKKRARNDDGTLRADDPQTADINEAWQ